MKIILISGMFPPMLTGTAFYTHNLALALQKNNHQVEIVTLGKVGVSIEDGITVNRLKAISLPLAGFFKHLRFCSWNITNWLYLRRIIRNNGAEVILLVNHYLDIAFPSIFASWSCKIPLVCSVGTQLQSTNPLRNRILNLLDKIVCGYLVFPFCNLIVAWDKQILKYLDDIHGHKVTRKTVIVNYGVAGDARSLFTKKKNYSFGGLIVGVGAVSEQRNFIPLIRAFALLVTNFPNLRLKIIGHVYYDKAIDVAKNIGIFDKVDFLGELPHEEVLDIVSSSDVFYSSLTGKYLGMGTATIEAMLLGVPTVVNTPTDLLGTRELVDGKHFIQSLDFIPCNIANRINLLLENEKLRQDIGQQGRAFVKKNLNWKKIAKDMSLVLEQQINKNKR